jgi:serine/threonine protein kinase
MSFASPTFSDIDSSPQAFGFSVRQFLKHVQIKSELGPTSHHVENYIQYFQHGLPVFENKHDVMVVEKTNGMFATIRGKSDRIHISALHTKHTVSLYNVAHCIKTVLEQMPDVLLRQTDAHSFKTVSVNKSFKHRGHSGVILNARHMGKRVVLKTTTKPMTQLRYIIEAVIHYCLMSQCPQYFPKLHFIGMTADKTLVVCSEQLDSISITSFMRLDTTRDKEVTNMVKDVCQALVNVQSRVRFTHRDCHTSNIYYDSVTNAVKFIDFDWSCLQYQGRNISVPRHLYDTTRAQYCSNNSVDCCIFLRTLGPALKHAPLFRDKIYKPLMLRYEQESRQMLKKWSTTDTAAMQLYKMSTCNLKMRGHYSHSHGLNHKPRVFDYLMGYYEWSSMTPQAILDFINTVQNTE